MEDIYSDSVSMPIGALGRTVILVNLVLRSAWQLKSHRQVQLGVAFSIMQSISAIAYFRNLRSTDRA